MSIAANTYKRIGGLGHQLAAYSRLYVGSDHLLHVSFAGFNERYKRFYFRDIQALIVMPTSWWLMEIAVLAAMSLGALLIGMAIDEPIALGVFGAIAAILFVLGIWSALRGQSCRTYVRTAVQVERLASLSRVRTARKTIATLQPLITSSQANVVQAMSPVVGTGSAHQPAPAPEPAPPTT